MNMGNYSGSTFFDTAKLLPLDPKVRKVHVETCKNEQDDYICCVRLLDIIYHVRDVVKEKSTFDRYISSKLFLNYTSIRSNLRSFFEAFSCETLNAKENIPISVLKDRFPDLNRRDLERTFHFSSQTGEETLSDLIENQTWLHLPFLLLASPILVDFEELLLEKPILQEDERFISTIELYRSLNVRFPGGLGHLVALR
tara:strand:- start:129 stop:722 length:594 start_codon:yes stop_codon:yes gene_type:complete